jgi:hypothetical protein
LGWPELLEAKSISLWCREIHLAFLTFLFCIVNEYDKGRLQLPDGIGSKEMMQ